MAKRRIVFIFFYFILFLCSSCSTLKRESTPSPIAPAQDEKTKTSEIYGPQDLYGPKADEPKKEAYGPEPIQVRPLVLVFGPGLARGFAYIGILKALEEAKIPIGAIVGTEMGALVGIFYSLSQNINEFEWSFQKLKFFHNATSLLSKFKKTVFMDKKTEKIINQTLGEKEIQQGRTPLYLIFDDLTKHNQILFDKGKGALLAKAALTLPGFFAPEEIFKNILSAYNKPFPVSEAKVLGIGAVIVIDVLSAKDISSNSESNEQTERLKKYISTAQEARVPQASEVDLVIQPDMSEIGFLDFDKRSEIIFRGKEAVLHNLSRLKHLTGIEEKHE